MGLVPSSSSGYEEIVAAVEKSTKDGWTKWAALATSIATLIVSVAILLVTIFK
jgi:hypothetical protein